MNFNQGKKLIYINSEYGNGQVEDTGADFLAIIPAPIETDNEHSSISMALHSFNFINALYNIEKNDRLIWKVSGGYWEQPIYIEVLVPTGFYTLTDLINLYPDFKVYDHGNILGGKPDYGTYTVSTYTLEKFGKNNTWVSDDIPTESSDQLPTAVPDLISFSTVTGALSFGYSSKTVTTTDFSGCGYATTRCTVDLTVGGYSTNLLKRFGFLSNNGSNKYKEYELTPHVAEKVPIPNTSPVQYYTDRWKYYGDIQELPYCINLQRTSVIYIHLDLMKGTNISSTDNFHESDIFAIVPFSETFGEIITYIPNNLMWHDVNYQNITTFRITMTDGNGDKINFNDVPWNMSIAYEVNSFDYSSRNDTSTQRYPNVLSSADSRMIDPLSIGRNYEAPPERNPVESAIDIVPYKRGRF